MSFRRVLASALVAALMIVPAVGRAVQRIDPPNAKRLSAPYRSVDVRPIPVLVAPDTSAIGIVIRPESGSGRLGYRVNEMTVPAAPDVSDRGTLRGPPALPL
jgi:hypothetical protein